ncbi:hypothetical protein FPQ18DRAFT_310978 [Pyronema domesticum]|nr:hypothetical protein FPQ18DRAFT_310978 [Pyronema domesticum]
MIEETVSIARQHPPATPSSPWRDFFQVNHRHEIFALLEMKQLCCIACNIWTWVAQKCSKCDLILCSQCVNVITRSDVRGNLKFVISVQARWKFGYSQEFMDREKSEAIRDYRNGLGHLKPIPPPERKSFMRHDFDNGGIDIVENDYVDCSSILNVPLWGDSESNFSVLLDEYVESDSDSEWEELVDCESVTTLGDSEYCSDTEDSFDKVPSTDKRNADTATLRALNLISKTKGYIRSRYNKGRGSLAKISRSMKYRKRTREGAREGAQNPIFKLEDLNPDGKLSNHGEKELLDDEANDEKVGGSGLQKRIVHEWEGCTPN